MDLNNRWREAQLAEEEEIRRILAALSGQVAAEAGPIQRTVEALGDLDFIFAKARYAHEIRGTEPELIPVKPAPAKHKNKLVHETSTGLQEPTGPEITHPGTTIKLLQARHPLLDPLTVVPVDIYTDDSYFVVIITGPNTGGKTVSLKTTGLLTNQPFEVENERQVVSLLHLPGDTCETCSPMQSYSGDL